MPTTLCPLLRGLSPILPAQLWGGRLGQEQPQPEPCRKSLQGSKAQAHSLWGRGAPGWVSGLRQG